MPWALTPVFTHGFLMAVFRHPCAREALLTFLRRRCAARAVSALLRHHATLASACCEPDTPRHVLSLVGSHGLGAFLRTFLLTADTRSLARLLRHSPTARLLAEVLGGTCPARAAELVFAECQALATMVARLCSEPGIELWVMRCCRCRGMDAWLGEFLIDARGAAFARLVLLSPGFADWVEAFLRHDKARAFVFRLLQRPGVCRFVTWLNRDVMLQRWFAQIVPRDSVMLFITELLLEPGLDRFIVDLLLRPGNDAALRAMLEYWVRCERSLGELLDLFAQKEGASRALAKVLVSPGFLDRFVLHRLLPQPGFAEVVLEALMLVGVRGLRDTVLPLALSTLAVVLTLGAEAAIMEMGWLAPLLESMEGLEGLDSLDSLG